MKIKKTTIRKKIILIILLIVLSLIGLYGAFAYASSAWPFRSESEQTSSSEDPEAAPERLSKEDAESKQDFIDSDTGTDESNNARKEESASNSGQSESQGSSERAVMSTTQEGSNVVVITKLYGVSGGNCNLRISNGSTVTTKSAEAMFQPEYSTCAGFTVPVSELGAGTWNFALNVKSDSGKTVTSSAKLQVRN